MVVLIKAIGMALPSLSDSQEASAQLCVNILSVLFCFCFGFFFFLILMLQSHSKPSTSESPRARLHLSKPP